MSSCWTHFRRLLGPLRDLVVDGVVGAGLAVLVIVTQVIVYLSSESKVFVILFAVLYILLALGFIFRVCYAVRHGEGRGENWQRESDAARGASSLYAADPNAAQDRNLLRTPRGIQVEGHAADDDAIIHQDTEPNNELEEGDDSTDDDEAPQQIVTTQGVRRHARRKKKLPAFSLNTTMKKFETIGRIVVVVGLAVSLILCAIMMLLLRERIGLVVKKERSWAALILFGYGFASAFALIYCFLEIWSSGVFDCILNKLRPFKKLLSTQPTSLNVMAAWLVLFSVVGMLSAPLVIAFRTIDEPGKDVTAGHSERVEIRLIDCNLVSGSVAFVIGFFASLISRRYRKLNSTELLMLQAGIGDYERDAQRPEHERRTGGGGERHTFQPREVLDGRSAFDTLVEARPARQQPAPTAAASVARRAPPHALEQFGPRVESAKDDTDDLDRRTASPTTIQRSFSKRSPTRPTSSPVVVAAIPSPAASWPQ